MYDLHSLEDINLVVPDETDVTGRGLKGEETPGNSGLSQIGQQAGKAEANGATGS